MRDEGEKISYRELERRILAKTNVMVHYNTIREWLLEEHTPLMMSKPKVPRQPPDEDAQIVRGLTMTDITSREYGNTVELILATTKDFFVYRVQRLLSRYGWTNVKPEIIDKRPKWTMRAFLDHEAWIHEFNKPVEELTHKEKMKLLSGAISGDGTITVSNTDRKLSKFEVSLATTERYKAELYRRILESMSIPYGFSRGRLQIEEKESIEIENTIPTKARCIYLVSVAGKNAIEYLLTNLRLLQPFREVKRILALRFIEKDLRYRDLVKPVWDWLRFVEKASTVRSQIRACELIPDEKFAEKNLNKQQMLERLRKSLHEYADRIKELKSEATKIISSLRVIPKAESILRIAEEASFTISKEAGLIIARVLEKEQKTKIANSIPKNCSRTLIATNLTRLGLVRTQAEAAKLLSIHQGTISRYLRKKTKASKLQSLPEIERLSREYFRSRDDGAIKSVQKILQAIIEMYGR